jgi:hypothetical protein
LRIKEFKDQYDIARCAQIESFIDDCLEIADNCDEDQMEGDNGKLVCNSEYIARSRLRIDTRKWIASKLAPKIYGDKIVTETSVTVRQEDAIKELS